MPVSPITPLSLPVFEGEAASQFLTAHLKQSGWNLDDKDRRQCQDSVETILKQVRQEGDNALRKLSERFGDALPADEPIALRPDQWQAACNRVPADTRAVLDEAARSIAEFAAQIANTLPAGTTTWEQQGYSASFTLGPVQRAGCYVPGGRYPLVSSALMTALSAREAGVADIAMACPNPSDALLYAAHIAGVQTFYRMGGAQAVGAWAFGTESVKRVDMIVGPGNRYVTEAKRLLTGWVGIDMIAGPSEVVLIADASARPEWVAADLLAQAEHDPYARVFLLTTDAGLAQAIQPELKRQMADLRLPPYVKHDSLARSAALILPTLEDCINAANDLAPEHLQLHGPQAEALADQLHHYGTLFVGEHATVPFGDYAAGPNHTLPTGASARFASALSPLTFMKLHQKITVPGPSPYLAGQTQAMAALEGLAAHGHAASLRG
jgi:histidinol dehydrogenase